MLERQIYIQTLRISVPTQIISRADKRAQQLKTFMKLYIYRLTLVMVSGFFIYLFIVQNI
jgi:hypothetical protein